MDTSRWLRFYVHGVASKIFSVVEIDLATAAISAISEIAELGRGRF